MSCLVFRSRRLRLRFTFRQGGALSTPLLQNRGNGGASPGDSGGDWVWCYVHRGTRGANLKPVSHQPSPHLLSPGRRCSANEQGRPERRISDISESEHVMTCFFVVGRSGELSVSVVCVHDNADTRYPRVRVAGCIYHLFGMYSYSARLHFD